VNKPGFALLTAILLCASSCYAALPTYGFIVKKTYPHDSQAFTQGLFYKDGFLYESTGLNGRSSLRKVELETGKVVQKTNFPQEYFAEGIAEINGDIVSLTWTSNTGFIFDAATFKLKQTFRYPGEGWGLTSDAQNLYMSDGTAFLRVLDPRTMLETRRIQVKADGKPLVNLNELEWVDGEIFANVWGTDKIARIDPFSGTVIAWIDLSGLLEWKNRGTTSADAVLNGIAYDQKQHRLFVTGKLWPKLFEIELLKKSK